MCEGGGYQSILRDFCGLDFEESSKSDAKGTDFG
jgi:hypothetical protein